LLALSVTLLAVVAGSCVYSALSVLAARSYLRQPRLRGSLLPVSILKPLAGADFGLEDNLRSFFQQDYAEFEVLMAVRTPEDGAVPIASKVQAAHPGIRSRLIVTGEPPYANAKIFSLDMMMAAAEHDLLVMADSDVRVTRDMLATVAAEFNDREVGLTTCPYRAAPGPSFWSTIEAIGMNTEFLGGVLTARMLEGMKFALGPAICARKEALRRIGGFERLKDYLAEDFVMGQLAAQAGWRVLLSRCVIEHHIGSQPFRKNLSHRIRWCRSTRRSRPWGYIGQVFTYPLPAALILWTVQPSWWPALAVATVFRALSAYATAWMVLRDPLTRRLWWLIPMQDLASFAMWVAGFFGNTIQWRGRRYELRRDGTFRLVSG
jgi:ceramide glucosyltransferase